MENNNHGGVRKGAGRPKGSTGAYKENKKNKYMQLRVTEEEINLISELAEKLGVTKSKAILMAVEELSQSL